MSKHVILNFKGIMYKILSFELNSNDGSLYLKVLKNVEIHYHSSGQINYKLTQGKHTIFCDPISNITKDFYLLWVESLPINKLTLMEKIGENDFCIDYNGSNLINMKVMITPLINNVDGHHIEFYRLFKLVIQMEDMFFTQVDCVYFIPSVGLYPKIIVQPEQSLIDFHQRIQNHQDIIIYEPNNEGVIRIIHSTPMRIPPRLTIIFNDRTLVAEQIMNKPSVSMTRFIVKDQYGNKAKLNISIDTIELDSEL